MKGPVTNCRVELDSFFGGSRITPFFPQSWGRVTQPCAEASAAKTPATTATARPATTNREDAFMRNTLVCSKRKEEFADRHRMPRPPGITEPPITSDKFRRGF